MTVLIIYCLAASIYPLIHRHCTLDIFHDGSAAAEGPLFRELGTIETTLSLAPSPLLSLLRSIFPNCSPNEQQNSGGVFFVFVLLKSAES